jgi:hypothetical protein
MHDLWPGLLVEAARTDPAVCLGELSSLALTAVRLAALALDAPAEDVLAGLLVERTAAAYEPAEHKRREGGAAAA